MKSLLLGFTILLFALSAPAAANETRSATPGQAPPPASISDVAWLIGHWRGIGLADAPAFETYSPAAGGTIVGHFVQEDGKGAIRFMELITIAEQDGSLVMKLKHFNADLTGWEEKADMEVFPLVAIGKDAAYFDGLTVRRDEPDGFVSAVQVKRKDGSLSELLFRYSRAALTTP